MAEQGQNVLDGDQKEDWMNAKWRPMMGWMYMLVCTMDFVVFPIMWSLLQAMNHGRVDTQWNPITLQGAGLFHMAMGAIIGVAAFGRTQEKLAGVNNGGANLPSSGVTAPSTPSTGFSAPAGNFSSSAPSTPYTPAPSWGTTPTATTSPTVTLGSKSVVPSGPQPEL
jgi:hypothetical protein